MQGAETTTARTDNFCKHEEIHSHHLPSMNNFDHDLTCDFKEKLLTFP